jgi:hypothetical protein
VSTSFNISRLDWKYLVTLFAAVAGIAVPVWLWRTDLVSHSVKVKIISQTALQPDGVSAVSGLKISVDGKELEAPYLTVIDIKNDGARPILATDFETPLEIKTFEKVKTARARVTATAPKDLLPIITSNDDVLKLQPLLLNPNDSVTIAFVTSGGLPNFSARGRIAGISVVELEDSTLNQKPKRKFWAQAIVGFALLIVYALTFRALLSSSGIQIRRRAMIFITLSSVFGSILFLISLRPDFDFSLWQNWPISLLATVVAMVLGTIINRSERRVDT